MSLPLRQIKDSVIIAILCVLLVLAWLIFKRLSFSYDRGFPPQPPEQFERLLEGQLKLTPSQSKQLEEERAIHMKEARKLFERLSQAQEALMEEFNKPTLDTAAISRLHEEVKSILMEMEGHRLKEMYELRNILTPEQFRELGQKMREFFGQRGGFPPPLPPQDD